MANRIIYLGVLMLTASGLRASSSVGGLQSSSFLQETDAELSEEIIDYIMSDVEAGAADPTDAYYNIQDMIADGTILPEDGNPALESLDSIINSGTNAEADLSKEIIDYIMTDVESGAADPTDAYYNIQDMIADGTILPEDGNPALESLDSIISQSDNSEAAELSKEIVDYILSDVETGAADPTDAYFNIQDMIADGTIFPEDGNPALESLDLIINPPQSQESEEAQLSKEIIDYIMSDVQSGAADPTDAYFNIQDMIADGTIFPEDGNPALESLNEIINTPQDSEADQLSEEIVDWILTDVASGEADPYDAWYNVSDMIADGTINETDGTMALGKIEEKIEEDTTQASEEVGATETSEETGSSEVSEETGSGEASEETGSGEVSGETGSGEVSEETGSGEVSGETGSGEASEETGSETSEETGSETSGETGSETSEETGSGEASGETEVGDSSQEAEASETSEEAAYDGNIYNVEDPTFYEEVTLEILVDVGNGEVTADQAIAQLAIMVDDEWINDAEYVWASEESINLEKQALENISGTEEVVEYILDDVERGSADPEVAKDDIQQLMDNGTVETAQGEDAIEMIEAMV